MRIDTPRCFSIKQAEHPYLLQREARWQTTTRVFTAQKHCLTADFTCFSFRVETETSHGRRG